VSDFSSSAEQSVSEVAGDSVGDQKIEENEKSIAAEEAVTAARRVDKEISSSSINEIAGQIRKQSANQVKIEKTLSLLNNSVKQIKQDLENSENQKEQYPQLLQEHNQILDGSMKQIQSKITELQKQITNVEQSISNIVTPVVVDKKKGKKNKKAKKKPLADVTTTDKEVKVIVEIPGISKENIKVNAYDNSVEVTTTDPERKYHEVVEIPPETDIETAKSTYKNGILEITFDKKQQTKPKGKQINIE